MNDENFLSVRRIASAARDGFGPYILDSYKFKYGKREYLEVLQNTLRRPYPFESHADALETLDLQAWLKAMESNWDEVFGHKLGHNARECERNSDVCNARNYLYELLNTRNLFAHEAPNDEFTDEDVYRIADTTSRLLRAAKRREQAEKAELIKQEYGRKIYGSDTEASEPEPELEQAAPGETEDQMSNGQPAEDDNESSEVRVDLSGLNLSASRGADLRGRNFHLANLQGADLTGSILKNVQLTNMNLSNVKLSKSQLTGANLSGSNLSHANLSGSTAWYSDLREAKLPYAKMEGISLREAKLDCANFSHANLTQADLSNSELTVGGSSLYDAFAKSLTSFDRLYDELCCNGVNFSDAILCKANMQRFFGEGLKLTRANLTEANLAGARIQGSNLAGATLRSAKLINCDILSCDFSGAKMQGINLSRTECVYSRFAGAEMSGAILKYFHIPEDDGSEDYSWDNVDLSAADLSHAYLWAISLRNARLIGAVFRDANLTYADLSNADLMDTDFTDAELEYANFAGAKFRYTTILPDGSYWSEDTDMTQFTGPPTEDP